MRTAALVLLLFTATWPLRRRCIFCSPLMFTQVVPFLVN
jgi:hypothetical protein